MSSSFRLLEKEKDVRNQFQNAKRKWILYLYSKWCPDCTAFHPFYVSMSQKYVENIDFFKLSIDSLELKDFWKAYDIVEIPSFLFFHQDGTIAYYQRGEDEKQFSMAVEAFSNNLSEDFFPVNSMLRILSSSDTSKVIYSSKVFKARNIFSDVSSSYNKTFYSIPVNDELVASLKNHLGFDLLREQSSSHLGRDGFANYYELSDDFLLKNHLLIEKIGKPITDFTNPGFTKKYDYDLIVIGAGSGGLQCAKKSSKLGARVAIINAVRPKNESSAISSGNSNNDINDRWGIGGVCVNVGCIPKKLFHHAALLKEFIRDSKSFGFHTESSQVENLQPSWAELTENIGTYISKLNWKYEKNLREEQVQYIHAYARFKDAHTIEVEFLDHDFGDPNHPKPASRFKTLTAEKFLIATGSTPQFLGDLLKEDQKLQADKFKGRFIITSDELFSLKTPPKNILVVGGGYVALECSAFLSEFGIPTTMLVREEILRGSGFDRECVDLLKQSLLSRRHNNKNLRVRQPCQLSDLTEVELDEFDVILLAAGRKPVIEPSLAFVGVKSNETEGIQVSEDDKTSVDNIFAVGDVIRGAVRLTPVAIQAGRLLAMRLFGQSKKLFNYRDPKIPTVIFTSPMEYGCCGLSEEMARSLYADAGEKMTIDVYKQSVNVLEHQLSRTQDTAFIKLLCVREKNGLLVGFHYIGPNAEEMLQGISILMKKEVTKEDLDDSVGIHPSIIESINSLELGRTHDTGCCG